MITKPRLVKAGSSSSIPEEGQVTFVYRSLYTVFVRAFFCGYLIYITAPRQIRLVDRARQELTKKVTASIRILFLGGKNKMHTFVIKK